ncbi:hypothetical protein CCACVL1_30906 [Corchorus capsularis]|uniref:Uncharacterized protein n=1 Tax=Corchorus capsularis TaxID=210143 RepID=A0A1R3FV14_COCAP|nr:hypothetical protein CCACVL1_30906 [Corchorus capsularis]
MPERATTLTAHSNHHLSFATASPSSYAASHGPESLSFLELNISRRPQRRKSVFSLVLKSDEVVKVSRAIRDVEDEESRSFFSGMSPWQLLPAQLERSFSTGLLFRGLEPKETTPSVMFARGTYMAARTKDLQSVWGLLCVWVGVRLRFQALVKGTTPVYFSSLYEMNV